MQKDSYSNKAEAFEAFDDTPLSPESDNTIGAMIARRYSRRDMLKGSLGVTAATALFGTAALTSAAGPAKAASAAFAFRELQAGVDDTHHVAEGYDADIAVWNPAASFVVDPDSLFHRHHLTPYAGRELYGAVESTFVAGEKIGIVH